MREQRTDALNARCCRLRYKGRGENEGGGDLGVGFGRPPCKNRPAARRMKGRLSASERKEVVLAAAEHTLQKGGLCRPTGRDRRLLRSSKLEKIDEDVGDGEEGSRPVAEDVAKGDHRDVSASVGRRPLSRRGRARRLSLWGERGPPERRGDRKPRCVTAVCNVGEIRRAGGGGFEAHRKREGVVGSSRGGRIDTLRRGGLLRGGGLTKRRRTMTRSGFVISSDLGEGS